MPAIVDKIFDDLGIQRGLSEADYQAHLDAHPDLAPFPIYSQDGKAHVARALATNLCSQIVSLVAITPVVDWRYANIQHDTSLVAELVFCPPDGTQNSAAPPTLAENILVDAWLSGLAQAIQGFGGAVLSKVHSSTIAPAAIEALYGSINCSSISSHRNSYPSFVDEKAVARIAQDGRFLKNNVSYSRLIDRALRESDARWRFFQFYRVLEQGYLENILHDLSTDFLRDPKNSLKQAEKSIASEPEQLKSLVASAGLDAYFDFMMADLEEIERYGNQFAIKIIERANKTGGAAKHDRGAAAIYAIRCAIAHAGTRDIYYEQFPDADAAVGRILSTFEEAVFSFLGVSLAA